MQNNENTRTAHITQSTQSEHNAESTHIIYIIQYNPALHGMEALKVGVSHALAILLISVKTVSHILVTTLTHSQMSTCVLTHVSCALWRAQNAFRTLHMTAPFSTVKWV